MSSLQARNPQSGMTLIEVLVSLFIVGSLIVLYAAAFNVTAMSRYMREENLAYHIASQKIEELRNTPVAALPASGAFADPALSQLPSGDGSYTRANYGTYDGVQELVVTVSWVDARARSISIRTLVGAGGINP